MTIDAFLLNAGGILALMALLSLVETLLPLVRKRDSRRLHRNPNLALIAMTLAFNFVFNAGAVLVSVWLAGRGFGLLAGTTLPPLAMILLGLVVLDVSTYACHRLLHRLPWLWSVHRVHHSDPIVDVTTTLRQHPIEGLVRFFFIMTPAWVLGAPPEAIAVYRGVSVAIGLIEHMNVRLWDPLDRALSQLVCTPNMHKVHHSRHPIETNSNYGNIFSLFDRVFGTFTPPSAAGSIDYGLAGFDDARSLRLGALLRLPLRRS